MKILADENIPHIKELFSEFATIVTLDGRDITADKLLDVDVLLVRSTTTVNKALLDNTAVKFVGTATIGMDHLDLDWLTQQGITYVNAPGCNSIAVSEYVLSGLLVLADKYQIDLRTSRVGIIGAGNVGTAVFERLDVMGIPYGLYDPPLENADNAHNMLTKQELAECEFVTMHVPLTTSIDSQWPTEHMLNDEFFSEMKGMRFLLNTARGDIINPDSLKKWLDDSSEHQCILDVWQNEPFIDRELLNRCFLGTPHIAGHTREGKSRGTLMLYHAFCKHFDIEDTLHDDEYIKRDLPKDIIHIKQGQSFMQAMSSAVWNVYDIRDDDKALRAGLKKDMTKHFNRLRKGYKVRREFTAHRLDPVTLPDGSRRTLKKLGFMTSNHQESRN